MNILKKQLDNAQMNIACHTSSAGVTKPHDLNLPLVNISHYDVKIDQRMAFWPEQGMVAVVVVGGGDWTNTHRTLSYLPSNWNHTPKAVSDNVLPPDDLSYGPQLGIILTAPHNPCHAKFNLVKIKCISLSHHSFTLRWRGDLGPSLQNTSSHLFCIVNTMQGTRTSAAIVLA